MKKIIKVVNDKYFNDSLDFRAQIFNSLAFLGIALGIGLAIFSSLINADIVTIMANLSSSVLAAILVWYANKTKKFNLCFMISNTVLFLIIFPAMFFSGGGYYSSMPSFFVFAVVFTGLMLEGRKRVIFTLLEVVLYTGCFLIAYFRPETITPFPSDESAIQDVIVGCLSASVVLAFAIYHHVAIYDNKQKELKKTNEQLHSLDNMKTEFLQNISHELRTPLTVMSNYAIDTLQELKEEFLNVQEIEFNQRRIRDEGERLKRMVNQLLDVTEIEGKQRKIYKEPISLAGLLSRVVDANFNMLNENGNRVEFNITGGLPAITADMDSIEQVLLNLISNATRHTRQGVITINLLAGNRFQEVSVADTGEGMPADIRAQVFLRYVERESRVTGRSGLGLYICKKHIDAHGGEIGIESEPGKGTTVWFRLPEHYKGR